LALPAAGFAVVLIVAAINFDRSGARGEGRPDARLRNAQPLLAPRTATPEELARAGGTLSEQTAINLTNGAWVQVADETGRLAQQYSAARVEPVAAGRLRMTEPRARVFLHDGRVMTMSSKSGLVAVPKRALESGALEGEVEIRLFKPDGGRAVDVLRDEPSLVVTAEQAQFDAISGEVRCEKAVRIETDAGSFAGQGLTLVLDADGEGVERLLVDRALEPIRIDRAARAVAGKRRERRNAEVAAAAPADAAAPAPAPAPGVAPPAAPVRFYRLVLDGGVEIVRIRNGISSTIRGEELVAVFSLESQGFDELAFVPAAGGTIRTAQTTMSFSRFAAPPALAVGALAFASPQQAVDVSASDSVTVNFGGSLEMVPVSRDADRLASKDDIRFDVIGSRVELLDGRSLSRIQCARLRYSVRDERVEAEGRTGLPLTVASRRMALEGMRFWASFADGVGRIEGPGRMAFARGAARDVAWLEVAPLVAPDAAAMLVSADPAAVALVARRQEAGRAPDPGAVRFNATEQELEINWKGGVDLRFAGDGDGAKISGARFEGGVDVLGRQFELASKSLDVAFSPKDSERIEAIIADGGTRVRQLGGDGAMNAERLELFLAANRKGDSIPSKLVARTAVEARDAKQTIWTEDLVVTFAEKRPDDSAKPADAAQVAGAPELGEVDVDSVEAKGGVQVLLGGGRGDGARVFAQELSGNARERRLRLTGDDVAIVRSNVIADNMRDLRFDDAARSARSEGPGRFRAFRKPIAAGEGRIERPNPDVRASLEASWNGALDFREVAPEKSVLDLRGDVKLRSRPSESAADAVDAASVVLDLGLAGGEKPKDAGDLAGAARSVDHFLARGNARLESRQWRNEQREGDPRVFRLTGEHIEYDLRTREGLVVGNGALLVHAPAEGDAAGKAAPARGATPIALGAEGTTRFNWKQRMALEHVVDDRFTVRMDDGVEILHAGLREKDEMTMRCDSVEALVKRPDESKSTGAESGVDLGGSAELLGVKGSGNVFIRTPTQDLECGEFDYSVSSGLATLKAAPGRAVTVMFANKPTPLQAQEIEWDLRAGRLEIRKPLVSGGR